MTPADRKLGDRAYQLGARHTYAIMDACRKHGVQFSLGLALVEQESGGRNVFGHDPTSSIPRSWQGTNVTRVKYAIYKAARKSGRGMQGVGPAQLTWYATQDVADKRGGCWRPGPNIDVGIETLAQNIRAHGEHAGIARYNGAGSAAEAYARSVIAKRDHWHRRLS